MIRTHLVMTEQKQVSDDGPELSLLVRARAGDALAFEALVKPHVAVVLGLIGQQISDPHLAEDAAQEALLNAFCNLGQLKELEKFGPWLYRIALRQASRLGQRHKVGARLDDNSPDAQADPACYERRQSVRQAVSELDEPYRLVVTLRYLEGLNAVEIGQRLKLPHGTVRARLSRATPILRQKLRRYL